MLTYSRLSKSPSMLRSFAGLELSEFDSLYAKVESNYDKYERKRLSRKGRKNEVGGGRPFKLELRDRLLMLLAYYRLYVTSALLSFLFDLGQTNVLKDIRKLEPLVKECIPLPEKLYERAKRAGTPEEVERFFPGFMAFIDSTEQEIPRPKNATKRKSHYSGKRKRHTVKTQLTVNRKGVIVHSTNHARGRRHDYGIFKGNRPTLPKGVRPGVDLGYDGIKKDFPELEALIPFKRRGGRGKKGRKLTPPQREFNKQLAKARVVVEHTISRMKKFRIMGVEFRNRLRRYDVMTKIVSGLINLRILGTGSII
jgi:hypothetical protein